MRTSILSDERLEFYQVHEVVYVWSDDLPPEKQVGVIIEINQYRLLPYWILVGDKKISYGFDYLEKLDNNS